MSSSAEVVAWHPGCSYVLVGCSTGAVRLFDVETGSAVRLLIGHACPITAAVVSPCGKLAFTADAQGCVRGWDLEGGWCLGAQWAAGLGSGNRHAASAIGMARVTSLAVSPSSRVLAVSGIDSRIVLLDIKAWRASTDRLRALHSPQLRFRDSASSSAGLIAPVAGPSSSSSSSSSLSLSGRAAGSINHVPRSVITAEPEVEEAALAEAASDAAAQAARSAVLDTATEPGAGTGSKIRFHVLYGKSTRFGFMAFSRDGVLAVAGVFDPPRRTGL
jgi:WD40 repeat protein